MTVRLCLLLLFLAWAALYLPALGKPELRGEEIRRILPAQGILESGDWVVPRIAGEVYANKPPLINWAIAGLFSITGSQSETSARLVSAISILVLALSAFFLPRKVWGNDDALLVALALLTTLTLISNGRLIEIEALFTALTGLGTLFWIRLWTSRSSPWLVWTLPYLFLGFACLAKGPVHLLFWFSLVIGALLFTREMRSFFHPAHFLGIFLMVAIFLPWMILNIEAVGSGDSSIGNWVEEFTMRGDVSRMEWDRWLTNPFKIPGGFLPWTVPLFFSIWFLWKGKIRFDRTERRDAVIAGSLAALGIGYVIVCLLPMGVPRYLIPAYPLAALATVDLFSRLPSSPRIAYERFGLKANRLLWWVFLIALPVMATLVWKRGETSPLPWIAAALVAVAFLPKLTFLRTENRRVLRDTALLIAAGGMGLLPAMQVFQGENDLFRKASAEIASKLPDEGRVTIYADAEFRNRLTKHLRLLFYLRDPVTGIGENGHLPDDTRLFMGQEEKREAMQNKLEGRSIDTEETLTIRGVTFLLFHLKG